MLVYPLDLQRPASKPARQEISMGTGDNFLIHIHIPSKATLYWEDLTVNNCQYSHPRDKQVITVSNIYSVDIYSVLK